MSQYGYLACLDCRVHSWLGKTVFGIDSRPLYFHRGQREDPPNSEKPLLTKALWRMLAVHTGHSLKVLLEHELGEDSREETQDPEGADEYLTGYIRNWPG